MVNGIKENHIKKFSRLVQELEELQDEIKQYCPNATFVSDTDNFALCVMGESEYTDYQYIEVISEQLSSDNIADIGSAYEESEESMKDLHYSKKSQKRGKSCKLSDEEIDAYYNGYCNTVTNPLPREEFIRWYFK